MPSGHLGWPGREATEEGPPVEPPGPPAPLQGTPAGGAPAALAADRARQPARRPQATAPLRVPLVVDEPVGDVVELARGRGVLHPLDVDAAQRADPVGERPQRDLLPL